MCRQKITSKDSFSTFRAATIATSGSSGARDLEACGVPESVKEGSGIEEELESEEDSATVAFPSIGEIMRVRTLLELARLYMSRYPKVVH